MNCYDFETYISTYIDGELKHSIRKEFVDHKKQCDTCAVKLNDITEMIQNIGKIPQFKTSDTFFHNLHKKITEFENRKPSIWQRFLNGGFFGFEPLQAVGFVSAIGVLFIASYLIFQLDSVPEINMQRIADNQKHQATLMELMQKQGYVADADSTEDDEYNKQFDTPIQLVGGSK